MLSDQLYGMTPSKVFPGMSFLKYLGAVYTDKIHKCQPKAFFVMTLLEDFDGVVDLDFLISQCWPNTERAVSSITKQIYRASNFLFEIGQRESISICENTVIVNRPGKEPPEAQPTKIKVAFQKNRYMRIVSTGQDVFVDFKNLAITKIDRDNKIVYYELANGTQGRIHDIENIDEVVNRLIEKENTNPVECVTNGQIA